MSVTNPDNEDSGMTEYERRILALEEAKLSGGCSSMGWPMGCLLILIATILAFLVVGPFGLIAIPLGLIVVWIIMGDSPRAVYRKKQKEARQKAREKRAFEEMGFDLNKPSEKGEEKRKDSNRAG